MQKVLIVMVLALTLSSAAAVNYTATNWFKAPVKMLEDTDYNFTNTSNLMLGGMTTSDLNIFAYNQSVPIKPDNTSSAQWTFFSKAVDTKALTSSSNTSYAFKAVQFAEVQFGYAIASDFARDNNNIWQTWWYQTKLNGAMELPRVALTSNTNASWIPMALTYVLVGWNTFVIFYETDDHKVNYTSIDIGGSTLGKEYTFCTSWDSSTDNIAVAWGEALSSTQIFVAYTHAGAYKVAVVDFSSGTVSSQGNVTGEYNNDFDCSPYVTDQKYYGVWCVNEPPDDIVNIYISSNNITNLVQMTSFNASIQQIRSVSSYSGNLTFFYSTPSNQYPTILSYEIWDLSTLKIFKNKTDYLTYNPKYAVFETYTIPQGGMYGLLFEKTYNGGGNFKINATVGQIFDAPYRATPDSSNSTSSTNSTSSANSTNSSGNGSSYLTSVIGFLMIFTAGLLLFQFIHTRSLKAFN